MQFQASMTRQKIKKIIFFVVSNCWSWAIGSSVLSIVNGNIFFKTDANDRTWLKIMWKSKKKWYALARFIFLVGYVGKSGICHSKVATSSIWMKLYTASPTARAANTLSTDYNTFNQTLYAIFYTSQRPETVTLRLGMHKIWDFSRSRSPRKIWTKDNF